MTDMREDFLAAMLASWKEGAKDTRDIFLTYLRYLKETGGTVDEAIQWIEGYQEPKERP